MPDYGSEERRLASATHFRAIIAEPKVQVAPNVLATDERPAELSHITCPECAGPHYEIKTNDLIPTHCRVDL